MLDITKFCKTNIFLWFIMLFLENKMSGRDFLFRNWCFPIIFHASEAYGCKVYRQHMRIHMGIVNSSANCRSVFSSETCDVEFVLDFKQSSIAIFAKKITSI